MPLFSRTSRFVVLASLPLASVLLSGCQAASSLTSTTPQAFVAGNWQVSSQATTAALLPVLSGELSGTAAEIQGVLHSHTSAACVAPTSSIAVTGSSSSSGEVTLVGPVAGGQLKITGTLTADGKSLENATYKVSGGTCAAVNAPTALAQEYAQIQNAYSGNFTDSDGQIATVQATLTQTPDTNGDGNYTLSGSANPNNPCFTSPVPVSNSQVTGNTFTFSYTDASTGNSVTATGTFNADASVLTSTWVSSGPCGADSGNGVLNQVVSP